MRFLLDTHTLIWALFDPDKLPVEIQLAISNLRNEIYVSTAKSRDLCLITHDKTISKYKDVQMKIY